MARKLNILFFILNVGLLAGTLWFWWKNRPPAEEVAVTAETPATNEPIVITNVLHEVITNSFQWAQLESEDYRTYIARLRSIGCPEQTIRDIIISDLDKVLAPRVQSASGHRKNLKYWMPEEEELANDWDPREVAEKMQQIDREKREVIQELVGVDLVRERLKQKGIEDYYERRLSFLPDEKQTQVRRIVEKYDEQERALRAKQVEDGEALTPQDQAMLQSLAAQKQAEVTALLSPEERKQYDLWMSPTANAVRHTLYGMDATERDFQTIYTARKQLDDQWGPRDVESMDPTTRQQYEMAKAQVDSKLRSELGPEKYREYKRGEDEDYHRLSATLTRMKLPHQKANEIYDMKQALVEARQTVINNQNLSAEQRDYTLRTLAQETELAARQALGEKAYNFYIQAGYANWMRN
jgi:hypothetical protein